MKKIPFFKTALAAAMLFSISSCNKYDENLQTNQQTEQSMELLMSENGANPDETGLAEFEGELTTASRYGGRSDHNLYTETNAAGKNEIMVFEVKHNGKLEWKSSTVSGGAGTGKGLGSQGAIVLDKNHEWLFAVNAGDHSVSSFKVRNDGSLKLTHTIASGGKMPISVTVNGNKLYVLNKGSDNIHGILIGMNGKLSDIPGATQPLSGTGVDAPQVSFTPNGDWLVVTEKATNKIGTFKLKNNGSIMPGKFSASTGATPFGFEFSRGRYMIVSNAAGGAAGAGSSTSYIINNNGMPKNLNGAVPSGQAAPCWVAIAKYGRFAYVTNTASNNVSSYYIAGNGGLYLAKGEAAATGMAPLDVVVSGNNFFVYILTAKSNTIDGYHRKPFGGLGSIGSTMMIPSSATGLATY